MKSARFPEDQASLGAWLEQNRKRREEPTKEWKEWWTLNKAIQQSGVEQFLPQPFVAEYIDERENGADFRITFADGTVLALDATEATTTEDRREIVRFRKITEIVPKGSDGGRFYGGIKSDADAPTMAHDIYDAIKRKTNKRYGTRSALLIYPNSNASSAEREIVAQYLNPLAPDSPFKFALVVLEHSLIAITKELVNLTPETVTPTG